ncbi:TRAP transporter large permease [Tepidiphilus thermophilus]
MAWLAQNLAPLMFLGLVFFLLYGFPVAFALGACGLFFGLIGIELGLLSPVFFQALPLRIFGIIQNETLLAVPFFTLMGLVLERSGMAEDLLDTIGQLFGSVRGGLAFAVIFVGALLAATTGVVAASVISMGLISLPIMLRYGYDRKLASGVIAASGTLAQIIPPSLVLIVLADQLGKSVGDLYKGAFIPAFALVGLYVLYVIGLTILRPKDLPALPPEARTIRENDGSSGTRSVAVLAAIAITVGIVAGQHYNEMLAWLVGGEPKEQPVDETVVVATTFAALIAFVIALINRAFRLGLLSRMAERVTFVLIPPLALIFLVLGTIFLGVATPTEGGAMGAVGAMLLAWARKRLDRALLIQALKGTTTLSSFVMFILIGSTLFNLTFQGVGGSHWVQHLLTQLPGGQVGFLIFAALFVFVLAFFLDYFELAFIVIPLLGPAASALGIDLIWFGVLIAMVMQTSFMHPPFGFALFFLRSVAPAGEYVDAVTGKKIRGVSTAEIYWGAIPFLVLQLVMVGLLIVFPSLVTMSFSKAEKIDLEKIEIPVGDQGWGAEGAADPGRGAAGGESSW